MGVINNLRNFFGLATKTNDFGPKIIVPGTTPPNLPSKRPGKKGKKIPDSTPIAFPSELQRMFDYWLTEVNDTRDTLSRRLGRYKDLAYMYYNNTVVSMAIDLYADEVVQYDSQSQVLNIESENKQFSTFIQDLFDNVGIDAGWLKNIAYNLALYGDSFTVNTVKDKEGVCSITPIDPAVILDRLEFSISALRESERVGIGRNESKNNLTFAQIINKSEYLQQLAKSIEFEDSAKNSDEVSYADYFKNYLFGYVLDTEIYGLQTGKPIVLPPWNISHYRLQSNESEFTPFGRPLLINAISVFRQLKASENLMNLARVYKFPKDVFTINANESMTETDSFEALNEARQEYHNLTYNYGNKETMSMNREIWKKEGVFDYEQIESRMDLDQIADVELLRENIIIGTSVPRGYLITDQGGFGNVGTGLLQQYKPFARKVYVIQTEILRELTMLVKIHCILTNKHVDEEFEITMNFPAIEDSSDRVRMRQDSLALAKEIIGSFAELLGMDRDEALPIPVVRDILTKYSFLNLDDIDDWVKEIEKMRAEKISESDVSLKESVKKFDESKRRLAEDQLKDSKTMQKIYMKSKKSLGLKEGTMNKRHYFSSFNLTPIQKQVLENLKDFGTKKVKL